MRVINPIRSHLACLGVACLCVVALACAKPKWSPLRTELTCDSKDVRDSLTAYVFYRLELYSGHADRAGKCLELARKLDDPSKFLIAEQANLYGGQGDLKRARALAEKVLELDPVDPQANAIMGNVYAAQKSKEAHTKAVAFYERAVVRGKEAVDVYPLLIQEYLRMGEVNKALASTQTLLKLSSDNTAGYFFLGLIYDDYFKEPDRALRAYEQVLLTADPNYPNYALMLKRMAQIYLAQEDYSSALDILGKLREFDPNDVDTLLKLALVLYEVGNHQDAKTIFETILARHPHSDRINYYMGLILLEEKLYDGARAYLKKISTQSDYYADAVGQVILSYLQTKQWKEAETLAERGIKVLPKEFRFYELLASVYIQRGESDRAKALWDSARDLFSDNWHYHYAVALYWDHQGDWQKATASMRQVLELDPKNVSALNYIGYTQAEHGVNLAEALAFLHKATALDPQNGYVKDSLGWAYFRAKQYADAKRFLEEASRLLPDEGTVLLHLGDLHHKLGDDKKAVRVYQRGFDLLEGQDPESLSNEDKDTFAQLKQRLGRTKLDTRPMPSRLRAYAALSVKLPHHKDAFFEGALWIARPETVTFEAVDEFGNSLFYLRYVKDNGWVLQYGNQREEKIKLSVDGREFISYVMGFAPALAKDSVQVTWGQWQDVGLFRVPALTHLTDLHRRFDLKLTLYQIDLKP